MKNRKPSSFRKYPWASVARKSEAEVVAQNIMTIMSRTGDMFRPLTWDEYKKEREKDGEFTDKEKKYFDMVKDFCLSADTARLFSPAWRNS